MDAKFPDNSYREEETDFEDLLQDNVLPDNSYRTLEQRRNRRKRIGSRGITACSDEEHSWAEDERKTFKGSTRVDVDKRLKLQLLLSLGKQGQKYFIQKHPYR